MMPGDPRIDEEYQLGVLSCGVDELSLPHIQGAALAVLIDMYDRKVTRDRFQIDGGRVVSLYANLGKLAACNAVLGYMSETGTLDVEKLTTTRDWLVSMATRQKDQVESVLRGLMECPRTEDPIN